MVSRLTGSSRSSNSISVIDIKPIGLRIVNHILTCEFVQFPIEAFVVLHIVPNFFNLCLLDFIKDGCSIHFAVVLIIKWGCLLIDTHGTCISVKNLKQLLINSTVL